ncbi:hypothetical protein D9M71_348840 [compost metagenome]
MHAEHPTGAQYQVLCAQIDQSLFTGQLACTVNTGRPSDIAFLIGHIRIAGEDVVGGDMQQRNPCFIRRFRQMRNAIPVDCICPLRLAFRFIDGGIGGGIDDQLRTYACNSFTDLFFIGDIQLTGAQTCHNEASRCAAQQFESNLTACTGNQYLHVSSPCQAIRAGWG